MSIYFANKVCGIQRERVVLPLNPARVGYQLVFALRLNATIALGRADHRGWQRPIPASGSAQKNTRLERGSRYNCSSHSLETSRGHLRDETCPHM